MPFPPVLSTYISPRSGKENWSYGCEVVEPRWLALYSEDLCYLVAACMKNNGDVRPGMQYLEDKIYRHMNQDWDETDAATEMEWRQFFKDP